MRTTILAGAFTVVALIAATGWTQKSLAAPPAPSYVSSTSAPIPVADRGAATITPVVWHRHRYRRKHHYRTRVVIRKRKFSHSAAIVGGSAAGGAAVGALAGGGKGAAIGALAGGAGGLIYDRATHKKKKRVVVR